VDVACGAGGYREISAGAVTPLVVDNPAAWAFLVADVDGDGSDQVVAVSRAGGTTELHILSGSMDGWAAHHVTGEPAAVGDRWSLEAD
jgi:hypothetical protein